MNRDIQSCINDVFEVYGNSFFENHRGALVLIRAVGILKKDDDIPEEINKDIIKLNAMLPTLKILDDLSDRLQNETRHHFNWNAGFRDELPTGLTLSPIFNITSNTKAIIDEIEAIRYDLYKRPVNYSAIFGWITKRAKEDGFIPNS